LYPDSFPPHPGLLSAGFPPKTPVPPLLPDPLPEPEVVLTELLVEAEEPQPAMTRTWSAIATEQTIESKNFNMCHPPHQWMRSAWPFMSKRRKDSSERKYYCGSAVS